MSSTSDYRAPDRNAPDDAKLGWIREQLQTGESYLKSQRAYMDIDRAMDIVCGMEEEKIPKELSTVKVNRLKRNIQEIVATLSNIRPMWGYKTQNRDYEKNNAVLNKLLLSWFLKSFADRGIREALQWAAVAGTGYISPIYDRDEWVVGRGDITLHTYGPRDVIPVQIGRDRDLQRAYAVNLRTEVPIALAHAMYPEYAERIRPDRESSGWLRRGLQRAQKWLAPALNLSPRGTGEDANIPYPTVDIVNTYIMDLNVNMGPSPIPMGDPGTSWFYEVPVYNSDIPTGYFDAQQRPLMRKATREDSMIYPLRRLITSVSGCVMYDNTSPWWHGKVPVIPFKLDDWPWEFLGLSMIRDADPIQMSTNRVLRAIDDKINVSLAPPDQYDENVISKSFMERFDLRKPRQHIPANFQMGEGIKPILDAQFYSVGAEPFEYLREMYSHMDNVMGVNDLTAIAKARQIPSSDSIEKIMEMAGPVATDRSRNMERSLRDLGEMNKALFFQFFTTARKLQVLGPDGLTQEDYDYDPGNMIPSHLPGEPPDRPSKYSLIERAKWHKDNFVFSVVPNSLHEMTQTTRKLIMIQLWRSGFPIDPWTVGEAMDLDIGAPPEGTTTVMQKYVAWKRMEMEFMQEAVQAMPQPQGGKPNGGLAPVPQRGRPPSGVEAPRIQTKDQGTRTTITQS